MYIRKVKEKDYNEMYLIFKEVIEKGDTYVFSPNTTKEEAYSYWFGKGIESYVAEDNGGNCRYVQNYS